VELSVVIPCLNGLPHLIDQLESLAHQEVDVPWELVVSDNGSTDGSVTTCESFAGRLPINVLDSSERAGQAHARNYGARRAAGDKLVFLDQDDVVGPRYLAAMAEALDHHVFVAARMDYQTLNPEWSIRARASSVSSGLRPGLYPWAYGCSLGIRREAFEAVGGFDEGLRCAEDVDFCWRINQQGGVELAYVPDAVVHYRLKSSRRAIFRQGLIYGRGGAELYRRWAQSGMKRRSRREVVRAWLAIGWRMTAARDAGKRAEAWYLLGNRIGCAVGSVRERVLFL
jgi:GT2 family glycosyltransferase